MDLFTISFYNKYNGSRTEKSGKLLCQDPQIQVMSKGRFSEWFQLLLIYENNRDWTKDYAHKKQACRFAKIIMIIESRFPQLQYNYLKGSR